MNRDKYLRALPLLKILLLVDRLQMMPFFANYGLYILKFHGHNDYVQAHVTSGIPAENRYGQDPPIGKTPEFELNDDIIHFFFFFQFYF